MAIYYINPISIALRTFDNNSYPLDYYKSFAWDGLRNWDVNRVLSQQQDDLYYEYRSTVIQNSSVCE